MADSRDQSLSPGTIRLIQFFGLAGVGTAAFGLWHSPEQTWPNLLLAAIYLLGLGLGGLVFVSLHHLTGARWSEPLCPVPEAMSRILPLAAGCLLVVLLLRPSLYAWSVPGSLDPDSPLRRIWLNRPFFLIRGVLFLGAWLAFAAAFARTAPPIDSGSTAASPRRAALSAAFLVVFGVTFWLASHDWIMTLEPDWTSTVFAFYNFGGVFLTALAAMTLLVVWGRAGRASQTTATADQMHDLGTLLFAFSSFWMYLWFFQYMLIWFVDNPEESAYFARRRTGAWPELMLLDLILNWGIPFTVLLFRSAKRSPLVLGVVAALVLLGRWVDLFLMIFPSQPAAGAPGPIEAGVLLGTGATFALTVLSPRLARRANTPAHL